MPFGIKRTPEVDLTDFEDDKEKLTNFLSSKLKTTATHTETHLTVDSDKITPTELEHAVTKFIYHQHLNQTYYATIDGTIVKIHRFKNAKKPEKTRKHGTSPTFAHGF
jgi:hypothetical protein